jgi:hypothetical protein
MRRFRFDQAEQLIPIAQVSSENQWSPPSCYTRPTRWMQCHSSCPFLHTDNTVYSNQLTSRSWALLVKPPVAQLLKNFRKILGNPNVHYRVHKIPPLVLILSLINPVQTNPSYLKSILILLAHLRPRLPSSLFPSGFPTQSYMPCPSTPWLNHSNYNR